MEPITIISIVAVLVGIGLSIWGTKIRAASKKAIKDGVADERWERILLGLHEGAWEVVLSVQQDLVDDLKEASKDGKLSEEEKQHIQTEALSRLKASVPAATMAFLNEQSSGSDQVDKLLKTMLSSQLFKARKGLTPLNEQLVEPVVKKAETAVGTVEKEISRIVKSANPDDLKKLKNLTSEATKAINSIFKPRK